MVRPAIHNPNFYDYIHAYYNAVSYLGLKRMRGFAIIMTLFPFWRNSHGWMKTSSTIGSNGYSTARHILFAAFDRVDDTSQETFNQLPPEVKRGFGEFSRKKTYSSSRTKYDSTTSSSSAVESVPQEQYTPLVFTLKSHLTGRRVDLSWQYSWQQQQQAASGSRIVNKSIEDVGHPSPWGPVSALAERKAMKVLLQTGEFTSSSQLSVERVRQIAQECVPVPWLVPVLSPPIPPSPQSALTSTIEDYSDGSDDNSHASSSNSSISSSSSSRQTNRSVRPPKVVAYDDFLEIIREYGGERMLFEQALSLRKQLLVDKIVNDGWKLRKNGDRIRRAYQQGVSLLDLAVQYDQPPVAIFRDMLTTRVRAHRMFDDLRDKDKRNVVKAGLRGDGPAWDMMSERDRHELATAKAVDHTSYAEEDSTERVRSADWEESLYAYLDASGVRYLNETALKDLGSPSTPDCVLLDDCYVNGRLVRWIDMKNFYGSAASKHFVDKLIKQASRYNTEFGGPGAIVYKLGHSEGLAVQVPGTLLLDRGPLNVTTFSGDRSDDEIGGGALDDDGQPLRFETIDGVLFM